MIHRIGSVCDWDGRSGFFFTRVEDRSTAGLTGDPEKKIFVIVEDRAPQWTHVSSEAKSDCEDEYTAFR